MNRSLVKVCDTAAGVETLAGVEALAGVGVEALAGVGVEALAGQRWAPCNLNMWSDAHR